MNTLAKSLPLVIMMMMMIFARVAPAAGARPLARPVARILEIKGRVTAQAQNAPARRLTAYGTVYEGDLLRAEPASSLVLAFRADGHFETLRGPDEVGVSAAGCQPARRLPSNGPSAEKAQMRQQVAVEALPVNVLGASVLRGQDDEVSRRVLPILRAVVPDPNPQFTWRAGPVPSRYRLRINSAVDRAVLWSQETTQTCVAYAAARPLEFGNDYEWEVAEQGSDGRWTVVCEGRFRVATQPQSETARWLRAAVTGDDVSLVALAALWFKRQDMVGEALVAAERLVALAPGEPGYHRLHSELLERAERFAAAAGALARAKQLAGDLR